MIAQERLKLLLAVYDVRVADVAKRAGLHAPNVSNILNCRVTASPAMVRRIEDAIAGRTAEGAAKGRVAR